jgi:NAD+ synthase (glutamine-hydrolysing)
MRLALAQTNPTIGDLTGNAELIERWCARAHEAGADLVVFPELALTGYPPKDLLWQQGFVEAVGAVAKGRLRDCTRRWPGLTVVVGAPLPLEASSATSGGGGGRGKRLTNSLLVYRSGNLVSYYDKRLLPTYDVFDENRYFTPGRSAVVIEVAGARVGLSICEDLWRGMDAGYAERYLDQPDPVAELCEVPAGSGRMRAELIVNPSASPFVLGKGQRHREILKHHARARGVYVAAVNQVGGNDELIFDGHAAVYGPGGRLIAAGPGFVEDLLVVDLPIGTGREGAAEAVAQREPVDPLLTGAEEERLFRALVLGVRDYCRKTGFASAVLGLSAGSTRRWWRCWRRRRWGRRR